MVFTSCNGSCLQLVEDPTAPEPRIRRLYDSRLQAAGERRDELESQAQEVHDELTRR